MVAPTLPTTDAERARVRDDLGRELYRCLNRDCIVPDWSDLPEHRRERYKALAVGFAASDEVDRLLSDCGG